jgi:hypothetical protein
VKPLTLVSRWSQNNQHELEHCCWQLHRDADEGRPKNI